MLLTFEKTAELINSGATLHIAGNDELLVKLPKGNWIGGMAEYFMDADGGVISSELLSVTEFPYKELNIRSYDAEAIREVAEDGYENGFSLVIMPQFSDVWKVYAEKAPYFKGMFVKNVIGWVAGAHYHKPQSQPIVVNGQTGEVHSHRAIVMHIAIYDNQEATVGMLNIFTPNKELPVVKFLDYGTLVHKCLIDGKETVLTDFLRENKIDKRLPMLGECSGHNINVVMIEIQENMVRFGSPVFPSLTYRFANNIDDYVKIFADKVAAFEHTKPLFSCNCLFNFIYGELEGKKIANFYGPFTYGEISYILMAMTLVYLQVQDVR